MTDANLTRKSFSEDYDLYKNGVKTYILKRRPFSEDYDLYDLQGNLYKEDGLAFELKRKPWNSEYDLYKGEELFEGIIGEEVVPGFDKTSLISWWDLEEESGTRYDAYGTNHLTDNNTVDYDTGVKGNSAKFIRLNEEYLSIADNPYLSMGNINFSIAFWIKLNDKVLDPAGLVTKWGEGLLSSEYGIFYAGSAVDRFRFNVSSFGVSSNGEVIANSFGAPSAEVWYFIVVWYDAINETLNIQVNNGVIDSSTYGDGVYDGIAQFIIGNTDDLTSGGNFCIDEVLVAKRIWSPTEKTWLYNNGAGRRYSDL